MLIKRSFSIAGHRTSIALEPEFWEALAAIAQHRGTSVAALAAEADGQREASQPLASWLRILALREVSQARRPSD